MNFVQKLKDYQKKLDEKSVEELTNELYDSIRNIVIEETKTLDPVKIKTFIIDSLDNHYNATIFEIGETFEDKDNKIKHNLYIDDSEEKHKRNTVMEKIQEKLDSALIPTGLIKVSLSHSIDNDIYKSINNDDFIKRLQTILGIDVLPITLYLKEHCDFDYSCSYYPCLCFHTDKIEIADAGSDPFLQKLKDFNNELLEKEKKKQKEKEERLKREHKATETEILNWITENKKSILADIKETIIESEMRGFSKYEQEIELYFDSYFNFSEESHKFFKENLEKILGIENFEFAGYAIKFFPGKLVVKDESKKFFEITASDLKEYAERVEKEKKETRKFILEWVRENKKTILHNCLHFLKMRKYYKEIKNKEHNVFMTKTIDRKVKYEWSENYGTISIDVSEHNEILNQETKENINRILGTMSLPLDFKVLYDFCDCGLPWGIVNKETYFKSNIQHSEECSIKKTFSCIDYNEDAYKLCVVVPEI